MQNLNDSANFQYQGGDGEFNDAQSVVSRRSYSPNKTGGHIQMANIKPEDLTPESQGHAGEAILLTEGHSRQFEGKLTASRYVEQIKTGAFLKVKKDVDLNVRSSEQAVEPVANRFAFERELILAQIRWVNRLASMFTGTLGLLAGASLMHLLFIALISDMAKFLDFYAQFAMMFNLGFLILSCFCFVFGLTVALVYRQKSVEKQRRLDGSVHDLRLHYTVTMVVSVLVLCGTLALFALPKYTNVLYYKAISSIEAETVTSLKICYFVCNSLFLVAWFISSSSIKGQISEVDIDFEEGEDGYGAAADSDEETTAVE